MLTVRSLRIRGRVQGVGFRYSMRLEARRLGVTGWVRNRHDGSVEALVQGPDDAVQALIAWTRHGPPGARVTDIAIEPAAGDYSTFEQLPTQ